jgi:polar amino acid transport system permease protein
VSLTRREEYDRRQRLRGFVLAGASTAAVVGLIVWGVPQLSGWERVRRTFFDRETFSKTFRPILHAFLLDLRSSSSALR